MTYEPDVDLTARVAADMGIAAGGPMAAAQLEEFRKRYAEAVEQREPNFIPPPPLSPDEIRQLLRECVTVVKPGETLVLRCPEGWTAQQAAEMQLHAGWWLENNAPDVKALVVPHLDMAVVTPETDAAFLDRLERAWPEMTRRQMRRAAANYQRTTA